MSGEAIMQKWAILGNAEAVCLHGLVYNHPDHPDGKEITTPHITRRYLEEDGSVIYVAKNRAVYRLGAVDPEYEEDFPGSLQRIIDEIKAGVPVSPGAAVGPPGGVAAAAAAPAVIIEERPKAPDLKMGPLQRAPEPVVMVPGTPVPPLIRSTDRLPDVALFWWRPIEPSEKTDEERDIEAFESKQWAPSDASPETMALLRKVYLEGAAAARARKI